MVKTDREHIHKCKKLWSEPIVVNYPEAQEEEEEKEDTETSDDSKKRPLPPSESSEGRPPQNNMFMSLPPSRGAPCDVATPSAPKLNREAIPPPTKAVTGIDEDHAIICANISWQIYYANNEEYFILTPNPSESEENGKEKITAKVILFDNHGSLDPAKPAFAMAVTNDSTMILAWRGTTNPLDWMSDFALNPVISPKWGEAANGIRAQGSYYALVESDLHAHQQEIADALKDHSIGTVILTGHSLGGGMAQIAHLNILSEIDSGHGIWKSMHNLECRTLSFAAPMTIMDADDIASDQKSKDCAIKLQGRLAEKSCNIVFGPDIVPRSYGYLRYIRSAASQAVPEEIHKKIKVPRALGINKLSNFLIHKFVGSVHGVIEVAVKFRHIGTVLLYPAEDLVHKGPVALKDKGEARKEEGLLGSYTYESFGIQHGKHLDTLQKAHSFFPKNFAQYY